jgi:FixJ family two-component response regulator
MSEITPGARTVQLIERNDRERQALQQLLESLGFHVEAFTSLIERAPGSGECLLWSMDGLGPRSEELDELLVEMGGGTSVVLLGRTPPMPLVVRALKAGAVDVLCKPVELPELRHAVLEAFERSDAARQQRSRIQALRQRLERLTAREQEVFQRLITGQLNKQVGAELGITERTVKAHRASILRKVSVGSVAELVRVATTLEFGCQQLVARATIAGGQVLVSSDPAPSLSA